MSHVVTINTRVRDPAAVGLACKRLHLPPPENGRHRLFSGEYEGLAVRLEGWRYPVVCQTETGQLHYDNFAGRWGDRTKLDAWLQGYAVERAKQEARRQGHSVREHLLPSGSIRLTVSVREDA
jgi:hypothetical protein